MEFLKECQQVENQLLEHYWNNFDAIIKSNSNIQMTYHNTINYRDTTPKLKSHHFYAVLTQVYEQLKSLETRIKNRIYFRFDDKEKQKVFNYLSRFCFQWDNLEKYIVKQLKTFKNKDNNYYEFLLNIKRIIDNNVLYEEIKHNIELEFYEVKQKFKMPIKKEFEIRCNTHLTVDIDKTNFYEWIFIIDNNCIIGGTPKKAVFGKLIVPVKYSDYHKRILNDKKLVNSFVLKLNKYNKIEIIGTYETDVNYPEQIAKNNVGIDIGLNKLITASDGEIVEQNLTILKKVKKLVRNQSNRQTLEEHLKKKYDNPDFKLGDKNYIKKQIKLSTFIKVDNRYRIKQFLQGREHDHIIMENLDIGYSKTHSKETNYLLKRMGIQNIKNDLLKYCKEFGIKVSLVNPAFTSQQCPKCNHISRDNRKTQETFCCVNCGHTDNADHNASVNIMNRLDDKTIKLDTPFWRVKEILNVL